MNAYFPIFLDMEGKSIRIFGGGEIAARRARVLLEFGADVTVTAPSIKEELEELARQQERLTLDYHPYQPGRLAEEDFVFAATDDEQVNIAVYRECRHKGIPVNVASDKEKCDFYFPGIVQDGDITIGVTSGGKDHVKATEVTERIRRLISGRQGEDTESGCRQKKCKD